MDKKITNINSDLKNEWWYHEPIKNRRKRLSDDDLLHEDVQMLVDVITGNEPKGNDPFWLKSEKIFLSTLLFYIREEEPVFLNGKSPLEALISLTQEVKDNTFSTRIEDFFKRKPINNTENYYKTFELFFKKETIALNAYVDLQAINRENN